MSCARYVELVRAVDEADQLHCYGINPVMIAVEFIENHSPPDDGYRPDGPQVIINRSTGCGQSSVD